MTPSLHSVTFSDRRVDARDFITLATARKRRRGDRITTFFAAAHNVCFWHKADIARLFAFGGKADIGTQSWNVCLCQKQTFCAAANNDLFDHLVGALQE